MFQLNEFSNRSALDTELADKVAGILSEAVARHGKASIAVSGGSTPKGFFQELSNKELPWANITITLADERWVDIGSNDSNTRLVHENLLQNRAVNAKFFHLKQGESLTENTLNDLNIAAETTILPLNVLILGMGEDGHTASLFPCSDQIEQGLAADAPSLMKVVPKTAPHDRITFSFNALKQSEHTFLHISGDKKKEVLEQALNDTKINAMPIRAFLHDTDVMTNVYWAE